jgi:hypothetical protein
VATSFSVKPEFARVIPPKYLHRRKILRFSSEKRPYFAHFTTLKIEPHFTKNFSQFWLGTNRGAQANARGATQVLDRGANVPAWTRRRSLCVAGP